MERRPPTHQDSRIGCAKLASTPLKRPRKAEFSALAASRSAMRRRQHSLKFPLRSEWRPSRDRRSDALRDLASLKDNFARLASQAGGEAVKTMRGVRQTVAAQVGGAASEVATRVPTLPYRPRSTFRRSRPSSSAWHGKTHWARLRARCLAVERETLAQ